MRLVRSRVLPLVTGIALSLPPHTVALAQAKTTQAKVAKAHALDPRLEKLKAEALAGVDARSKQVQEIIDQVFSFPLASWECRKSKPRSI